MDCKVRIKELRESTGMNRKEFYEPKGVLRLLPDSIPHGY